MILADFPLSARSWRRDSSDFFLKSAPPIWSRVKRSLMKKPKEINERGDSVDEKIKKLDDLPVELGCIACALLSFCTLTMAYAANQGLPLLSTEPNLCERAALMSEAKFDGTDMTEVVISKSSKPW